MPLPAPRAWLRPEPGWGLNHVPFVSPGRARLAALPGLGGLIKTLELTPSRAKVEYWNVAEAGDGVAPATGGEEPEIQEQPSYLALRDSDPNPALVGLRIEIEKRLNELASTLHMRLGRSLRQSVEQLRLHGILDLSEAHGLIELILAGTRAAHGAEVEPRLFAWALHSGPRVLACLIARSSKLARQ